MAPCYSHRFSFYLLQVYSSSAVSFFYISHIGGNDSDNSKRPSIFHCCSCPGNNNLCGVTEQKDTASSFVVSLLAVGPLGQLVS